MNEAEDRKSQSKLALTAMEKLAQQLQDSLRPRDTTAVLCAATSGLILGLSHQQADNYLQGISIDKSWLGYLSLIVGEIAISYYVGASIKSLLPHSAQWHQAGSFFSTYFICTSLLKSLNDVEAISPIRDSYGVSNLLSDVILIPLVTVRNARDWAPGAFGHYLSILSINSDLQTQKQILANVQQYTNHQRSIAEGEMADTSSCHSLFASGRKVWQTQMVKKVTELMKLAGKDRPETDEKLQAEIQAVLAAAATNNRDKLSALLTPYVKLANSANKNTDKSDIKISEFLTLAQFLATEYEPLRDYLLRNYPELFEIEKHDKYELALRNVKMALDKQFPAAEKFEELKKQWEDGNKGTRRDHLIDANLFTTLNALSLKGHSKDAIEGILFSLLTQQKQINKKINADLEREIKTYLSVSQSIEELAEQNATDYQWEPFTVYSPKTPFKVLKLETGQVILKVDDKTKGNSKFSSVIILPTLGLSPDSMASLTEGKTVYIRGKDVTVQPPSPKQLMQNALNELDDAFSQASELKKLQISPEVKALMQSENAIELTRSYSILLEYYQSSIDRLSHAFTACEDIARSLPAMRKDISNRTEKLTSLLESLQENTLSLQANYEQFSRALHVKKLNGWLTNLNHLKGAGKDVNSDFCNAGSIFFIPAYQNLATFVYPNDKTLSTEGISRSWFSSSVAKQIASITKMAIEITQIRFADALKQDAQEPHATSFATAVSLLDSLARYTKHLSIAAGESKTQSSHIACYEDLAINYQEKLLRSNIESLVAELGDSEKATHFSELIKYMDNSLRNLTDRFDGIKIHPSGKPERKHSKPPEEERIISDALSRFYGDLALQFRFSIAQTQDPTTRDLVWQLTTIAENLETRFSTKITRLPIGPELTTERRAEIIEKYGLTNMTAEVEIPTHEETLAIVEAKPAVPEVALATESQKTSKGTSQSTKAPINRPAKHVKSKSNALTGVPGELHEGSSGISEIPQARKKQHKKNSKSIPSTQRATEGSTLIPNKPIEAASPASSSHTPPDGPESDSEEAVQISDAEFVKMRASHSGEGISSNQNKTNAELEADLSAKLQTFKEEAAKLDAFHKAFSETGIENVKRAPLQFSNSGTEVKNRALNIADIHAELGKRYHRQATSMEDETEKANVMQNAEDHKTKYQQFLTKADRYFDIGMTLRVEKVKELLISSPTSSLFDLLPRSEIASMESRVLGHVIPTEKQYKHVVEIEIKLSNNKTFVMHLTFRLDKKDPMTVQQLLQHHVKDISFAAFKRPDQALIGRAERLRLNLKADEIHHGQVMDGKINDFLKLVQKFSPPSPPLQSNIHRRGSP